MEATQQLTVLTMPSIESTGNRMTLDQREADAVRYIIEKLQRIERELDTLGHKTAAGYCWAATICLEGK